MKASQKSEATRGSSSIRGSHKGRASATTASIKSSRGSKDESTERSSSDADDKTRAEEIELLNSVVPHLLMRSYHLPGYNYSQDLWQYLINNHPIFGICFHHPLHPVKVWIRIAALVGSIMFGLAVTNFVYLAFVFSDEDYDEAYVAIPKGDLTQKNERLDQTISELTLSNGNIALWTLGAALHALYDNVIWAIAAWNWKGSLSGRVASYQSMTKNVIIILCVLLAVGLSTFAATLRAAMNRDGVDTDAVKSGGLADDEIELFAIDSANDFEFMIAYMVELVVTYFLWYFLMGYTLFTGILGCKRIPLLGGRPFEVKREEEERERLGVPEAPQKGAVEV